MTFPTDARLVDINAPFRPSIAGKIVRRTNSDLYAGMSPGVFRADVSNYIEYDSVYPYDFEGINPNLSPGIILGKLTGYYILDNTGTVPYYKCEMELFNHVWTTKGNPCNVVYLRLKVSDGFNSNQDYLLLEDAGAGTITGNVARSHYDRGGRQNFLLGDLNGYPVWSWCYFPFYDPDYFLYSDPDYWDSYFNNVPFMKNYPVGTVANNQNGWISTSQNYWDMFQLNGTRYKVPRTSEATVEAGSSTHTIGVTMSTFWGGGSLKTRIIELYEDNDFNKAPIQTFEQTGSKKNTFGAINHVFYDLLRNHTYYVKGKFIRWGNPLLGTGELETDVVEYGPAAFAVTTQNEIYPPDISVSVPIFISNTGLTVNFRTTYKGDYPVLSVGVCCATNSNPTISDIISTVSPSTIVEGDVASISVTGLTLDTDYWFKGFIHADDGTEQGITYYAKAVTTGTVVSQKFRTLNLQATTRPTVILDNIFSQNYNVVRCTAHVSTNGGARVTEKGIVWSKINANPTLADFHAADPGPDRGELELYYVQAPNLTEGVWKIAAYATNSVGTSYSAALSVTIGQPPVPIFTVPQISMSTVTGLSNTTATLAGSITDLAGKTISAGTTSGFRYRTIGGNWQNAFIPGFSTTGLISKVLTGLTKETSYEVEVYLACGADSYESAIITFRTLADPIGAPIITIDSPLVAKGSTTAGVKATVVSLNGNPAPSEKGFCWDVVGSSITGKTAGKFVVGTSDNIQDKFIGAITGLTANTQYHVKAYVIYGIDNRLVLSGNEIVFTTDQAVVAVAPTVSATVASSLTHNSVVLSATITNNGTGLIKGIAISKTALPGTGDPVGIYTPDTSSSLNMAIGFTLEPSTTYHARAYARNNVGAIVWGDQVDFTTPEVPVIDGAKTVRTVIGNVVQHSKVPMSMTVAGFTSSKNGIVFSKNIALPKLENGIRVDFPTTTGTAIDYIFYEVGTYNVCAYATDADGSVLYGNVATVVIDSVSDNGFARFPYINQQWTYNGIVYIFNGIGWVKYVAPKASVIVERGVGNA